MRARWNLFWFRPTEPTNLGICRLTFFGLLLLRHRLVPIDPTEAAAWAAVPDVFWMPSPLLGLLTLPVFSPPVLRLLEQLWTLALALSCVGVCTRLSTAVAVGAGAYLLWLPHNFGKLHHMDGMVVLVMGTLALSRCGDAWSVDSWIARRRHPERFPRRRCGEYTWPIRVVWLLMAIVFAGAGLAKLRNAGLDWVFSDNLSIMLIKANYNAYTGIPPLSAFGLAVAQHPWLCRLLAGATLALEVGYPLALTSRRLRLVWVPATLLALIGMFCLVVPAFVELIGCHVFWVPWDRLRGRPDGGLSAAAPAASGGRVE
jgi:hypothetical protein